jgi:hypothetical protein
MNLDLVALLQLQRLDHDGRQTDGEAVAPFRNMHASLR